MPPRKSLPSKVTPLWIVASFVTLTEAVLGYAVTQVTGGVQVALTTFVIVFAVAVAAAFFAVLWHRPWVFYSPSEYGDMDPSQFMSALREVPAAAAQMSLARSVEEDPGNQDARFALIDSLSDDIECQFVMLMHELQLDVSRYSSYIYEHAEGSAGTGSLNAYSRGSRLEGTGIVRLTAGGAFLSLTDEGHRFAEWLIKRDRRCSFFWTPKGAWGEPKPGGPGEKMLEERMKKDRPNQALQTTPVTPSEI